MFFYFKKLFQLWFQKQVYLDYASTTPLDRRVFFVMKNVMNHIYGNPGGLYDLGTRTKEIILTARKSVAQLLGVQYSQVFFTRGGTEANNLAILGTVKHFKENYPNIIPHIITTNIEHDSVLNTCLYLGNNQEAKISYVPCNSDGIVDVTEIKKLLRPETILITVMYANNEIGTIQPIREISKLVRWYKKQPKESIIPLSYPLVHTDAVQAVNYCDMYLPRLGVDMMTLSGSKMYGPKSAGILVTKTKLIDPLLFGGGQESGLRPGTEDVSLITGIAKALEISVQNSDSESVRLTEMRDYLIDELLVDKRITLNGSHNDRLPNNISISISGYQSEQLVIQLDAHGFAVSSKSACQSGNNDESHVITALRTAQRTISKSQEGSLRITLGRTTKKDDVRNFSNALKQFIDK
jgi:cysteine desulfurase